MTIPRVLPFQHQTGIGLLGQFHGHVGHSGQTGLTGSGHLRHGHRGQPHPASMH